MIFQVVWVGIALIVGLSSMCRNRFNCGGKRYVFIVLVVGTVGDTYVYMADLLALGEKVPDSPVHWPDIPGWNAVSNMSLAGERPSVIDEFVAAELAAGRILGPVEAAHILRNNSATEAAVQVSRSRVVRKR